MTREMLGSLAIGVPGPGGGFLILRPPMDLDILAVVSPQGQLVLGSNSSFIRTCSAPTVAEPATSAVDDRARRGCRAVAPARKADFAVLGVTTARWLDEMARDLRAEFLLVGTCVDGLYSIRLPKTDPAINMQGNPRKNRELSSTKSNWRNLCCRIHAKMRTQKKSHETNGPTQVLQTGRVLSGVESASVCPRCRHHRPKLHRQHARRQWFHSTRYHGRSGTAAFRRTAQRPLLGLQQKRASAFRPVP